MRVNVYGEELTDRVELVTKVVDEDHTFYGVRFWLKFPNQDWWIHRKVDGVPDDDSSAITIWADSKSDLEGVLSRALAAVRHSYDSGVPEQQPQQFEQAAPSAGSFTQPVV